jgi:hypothetical protein
MKHSGKVYINSYTFSAYASIFCSNHGSFFSDINLMFTDITLPSDVGQPQSLNSINGR